MLTHVEFRSDRFAALDGEEEQVNPGLWGKRLADFLREGLTREGFATFEPIPEDWGWVVKIANESFPLWIGCGHYQEHEDGYLCFIVPHKPFVRRFFRKIDTRARVHLLQQAMDKILCETSGVLAKRWWTHEAFNHQPANRF